jgi:hypothetical protein
VSKRKLFLTLVLFLCSINPNVYPESLKGKIGIGGGNPYVCLKYYLSPELSIEARGAFGSGVNVYGGRFYFNFSSGDKIVLFLGGEGGYIQFGKDDVSGEGWLGYGFVGGEYFIINKRVAVTLDIGAAFINLEEEEFNLGVEGVEYIFNIGVNFYLN